SSECGDRARPSGRALRSSGRSPRPATARRGVRRLPAGVADRAEWSLARPVGQLPVQRAHGAAPHSHPAVSSPVSLRPAGRPGPTPARPAVAARAGHPADTARDGGGDLHGSDRAVAPAALLRSGYAAPWAAHRPASGVSRYIGCDVVAGALTSAGAAAGVVSGPAAVSVPARHPDVGRRGDDYAGRYAAISVLHGSAARVGPDPYGRSADRWPDDVGPGGTGVLDGDDGGVVPVVGT